MWYITLLKKGLDIEIAIISNNNNITVRTLAIGFVGDVRSHTLINKVIISDSQLEDDLIITGIIIPNRLFANYVIKGVILPFNVSDILVIIIIIIVTSQPNEIVNCIKRRLPLILTYCYRLWARNMGSNIF